MAAVGIDACRTGWIAVALRPDQAPEAHHLATIDELAAAVPDVAVAGIDIPIGLPERGHRRADLEARGHLGPRRHSLFLTPPRAALAAPTHAEATAIAVRLTGSGLSQQSYGLAAKVLEVERFLPAAPCPVFEVHPELSFAVLLGRPAQASKRCWAGMSERRAALADAGIDLDGVRGAAGLRAATDDMLDAGAAAWTALRLLAGTARCIPDPPEPDREGRAVAIWS